MKKIYYILAACLTAIGINSFAMQRVLRNLPRTQIKPKTHLHQRFYSNTKLNENYRNAAILTNAMMRMSNIRSDSTLHMTPDTVEILIDKPTTLELQLAVDRSNQRDLDHLASYLEEANLNKISLSILSSIQSIKRDIDHRKQILNVLPHYKLSRINKWLYPTTQRLQSLYEPSMKLAIINTRINNMTNHCLALLNTLIQSQYLSDSLSKLSQNIKHIKQEITNIYAAEAQMSKVEFLHSIEKAKNSQDKQLINANNSTENFETLIDALNQLKKDNNAIHHSIETMQKTNLHMFRLTRDDVADLNAGQIGINHYLKENITHLSEEIKMRKEAQQNNAPFPFFGYHNIIQSKLNRVHKEIEVSQKTLGDWTTKAIGI